MKANHICILLFLCLLLSVSQKGVSQSHVHPNTIYAELGGNALFVSLNYERQLLSNKRLDMHIGAGIYGVNPGSLAIPVGLRYLFQLHNPASFIDIGFGATYTKADVVLYAVVEHRNPNYINSNHWNYVPNIGYRRITKRNMMYRFSLAPVINNNGFLPFAGFSIGKNF